MCTINRIEIDNPDMWEVADNQFLKNITVQQSPSRTTSLEESTIGVGITYDKKTLIINEIVQIIEYAPFIYQNIRAID
jgi:hypothetical protein